MLARGKLAAALLSLACACDDAHITVKPVPAGLTVSAEAEGGRLLAAGPVAVLDLQGSYRQMGRQYGTLLKADLNKLYELATTFYMTNEHKRWTYDRMKVLGESVYKLYPQRYKEIILGMAETSGLGLEKQKILNAVELIPKIEGIVPACSGIAAWGPYTGGRPLVFGRNNDDGEFFKKFSQQTVVAVFRPNDSSIPAAIINYAGVIYSPTGINRDGLFLELNSGSAFSYRADRYLLLLSLFSWLQEFSTLDQVEAAFKATRPNMSSLVNSADPNGACSFECPMDVECKRRPADRDGLLAGTNHFMDVALTAQFPPEKEGGDTIQRRDNLLAFADRVKGRIDAEQMKVILDTYVKDGGATVGGTIQSIVAVPRTLTLYLKAWGHFDWQKVELDGLLAQP